MAGISVSKVTGYTVLSPPTGVSVTKAAGYAVVSPPPGVSAAKITAYAVLSTETRVLASKVTTYAVLESRATEKYEHRGVAPAAQRVVEGGSMMQGDPRLILGPDGSRLQFTGGQPLMDMGLENLVLISLFTNVGWCGNAFMNPNSRIGSSFEEVCNEPITRDTLNKVRAVAEDALKDSALGPVQVTVTNPTGDRLNVHITVQPPGDVVRTVTLTRNAGKWAAQSAAPAYPHIKG